MSEDEIMGELSELPKALIDRILMALFEREDNEMAATLAVCEAQEIINNGLNNQDEFTKEVK